MKGLLVAAIAAGALATACGGSSDQTLTLPTVTPPSKTEVFTGTFGVGETKFHPFTVGQAGEVDITLTAVGPPPTIFVGLGVGVPNDTGCVLIQGFGGATQAGSTPQIVGNALAGGPFCVAIGDIGNLSSPVDYSITVVHPE